MIDEKVLIEKLEEEVIALEDNFGDLVECIPFEVVFEIVNQLAEEYIHESSSKSENVLESSSGWIPCSERLPEIGTLVLATTESGNVCDDVLNYDYDYSKAKEPCFHRWDDEMWECYTPRVIAWQPLLAPYKGDRNDY